MRSPLVSVVMAVRNGERFVAEALESVVAQRHRPLEILVVDGASTDRTAEIAAGFPEVRVVQQPGSGIPDAWNHGIGLARGELLAFISHDDRWTPHKLELQLDLMRRRPELLYTVGMLRYFLEPGEERPAGFRPELLDGEHVGRVMETLVARPAAFELVGPFSREFAIGEDVDWFARAKDLGAPMAVVRQVVLHKRVHGANTSTDPELNSPLLLRALRRSIERQRAQGGRPAPPG